MCERHLCAKGVSPFVPRAALEVGRRVSAMALGPTFTVALLEDGKLKCWGDNPASDFIECRHLLASVAAMRALWRSH